MTQAARQPSRITPEELRSMMDRGEPVTILDVRSPESYLGGFKAWVEKGYPVEPK